MDQRIERHIPRYSREDKVNLAVRRIEAAPWMSEVGIAKVEELDELEESGFDLVKVQYVIDRLSASGEVQTQKDAALLRGAFNDLLARLPDTPEAEMPPIA